MNQRPNGASVFDPDAPFDLTEAQKAVGQAVASYTRLVLTVPGASPEPEAVMSVSKDMPLALAAASRMGVEFQNLRDRLGRLRDKHRPRPHADPTAPGALCDACSLHGQLVQWPCSTWTDVEALLTPSGDRP